MVHRYQNHRNIVPNKCGASINIRICSPNMFLPISEVYFSLCESVFHLQSAVDKMCSSSSTRTFMSTESINSVFARALQKLIQVEVFKSIITLGILKLLFIIEKAFFSFLQKR